MRVAQPGWLRALSRLDRPRLRLICAPHAGGAASSYRSWRGWLPSGVELYAVQLPGREDRRHERPAADMRRTAASIAAEIGGLAADRAPYVLFGHSLGAMVAFETARALAAQRSPPPSHLVLSSGRAPRPGAAGRKLHLLEDAELLREIEGFGGVPEAIRATPDFFASFAPVVRADFRILETHVADLEPALRTSVSVVGGRSDEHVSLADLWGWTTFVAAPLTLRLFEGRHFFLHDPASGFQEAFASELRRVISTSGAE